MIFPAEEYMIGAQLIMYTQDMLALYEEENTNGMLDRQAEFLDLIFRLIRAGMVDAKREVLTNSNN